MDATA